MLKATMPVKTMVIIIAITISSCNKEPMGYFEVRNHTNNTFTNVTWGQLIHLGTIAPGEENGGETETFTCRFLYLEIGNGIYRSREEIIVDANSSATIIVNDYNELIRLE